MLWGMSPTPLKLSKSFMACLAALLFAALGPAGCDDDVSQDVRDAFNEFNSAMSRHDADTAMKYIDPKNFEHEDQLLTIARSGSRSQIDRLTMLERWEVTIMRNRLKPDELRTMTGQEYFRKSLTEGWVDDEDDAKVTIGKISYKSPRAYGELIYDGDSTDLRLQFVRVEGKWMIDLDALDKLENRVLERLAAMLRRSEDSIIFDRESRESGRHVDSSIWDNPPK